MSNKIPVKRVDRTQLQQIIAGLTEGVILIDPDQTIAWANEMALTLHGVKYVSELGANVTEFRARFELAYRNNHKLGPGEYPMERMAAGDAFNDVIVNVARPGLDRKWVHQVRSLILTDEKGKPDCLVLIINDETERYNAEERFERAFGANPAPAIIARLSDMRYVKVNQGFLELTGYRREALIGRSVHEIDVLRRAEKRDLAVERLHEGKTIPQMEACLALPDGLEKTVLLGGQPIEIGDEACMLFTFADLHPRERAHHALRQSEERFAKAFHMSPGPMAIMTSDGLRILDVNTAFTAATGWRREELVGRSEAELPLWGEGEPSDAFRRLIAESGHVRSIDIQLRSKSGDVGEYLLSADTVEIEQEACVLCVMLDITERKQTETALLSAVEAVMQDTSWLGQKIVEKLAAITRTGKAPAPGPELASLSNRGREVLALIARGLSDEDIADRLGIARNTLRNHVSAIYTKLALRKRSAVIVWARERGLGVPEQTDVKRAKKRRTRRG